MSTKTIFKRISLVVVTALGLSLLSMAPSKAAYNSASNGTSVTVSAVGRENVGINFLALSSAANGAANACQTDCYFHTRLTGAPAASGIVNVDAAAAGSALYADSVSVTQFNANSYAYATLLQSNGLDTYTAGTYTFTWWVDTWSFLTPSPSAGNGGGTRDTQYVRSGTVSVTLAGAPASFSLDATSATVDSSSVTTTLVSATIKDAAGNATILTSNESFNIRTGDASAGFSRIGETLAIAGVSTVDSTVARAVYVNPGTRLSGYVSSREVTPLLDSKIQFYVGNSSTTSRKFYIYGKSNLEGINSAAFTLTMTNPAVVQSIVPTTTLINTNRPDTTSSTLGVRNSSYGQPTAITQADAAVDPSVAPATLYASTVTGKTINFAVDLTSTSGGLVIVTVAARTAVPLPTGVTAGSYNYSTDSEFSYIAFTATAPSAGDGYDVTFGMSSGKSFTYSVVYKAPTVSSATGEGSVVTNIDTTPKAAVGSSNTVTFTVKDGFGSLVSGATVKVQHNRTANAAASDLTALTTDANGNASYTFTDALTTAGSGLTTLNGAGTVTYYVSTANTSTSLSGSKTINYTTASFLTAGSITMVGTEVTDTAVAAGATANLVDAVINETITVKTDTGAVMSGIAYSATLSSGLYERKTYASGLSQLTGFTDASGNAFIRVACYKSGAQTITWTVGAKTATVALTCVSTSAKLRSIAVDSATKSVDVDSTGLVTVTATDIYGNVVPSVTLTVAYVGANGRVVSYNGAQGTTATTDKDGKLVIGIYADKAGTGTLSITATGTGVLSTTTTTTQGVAPVARVDALSVAVTSTGLSSTEKAVANAQASADAATDAALQAIDAANAATDAANLAAEAADAATVAAQEAKDAADAATSAVESLATQVATLMAALQAQVTSLANVVAKIAKKVKA